MGTKVTWAGQVMTAELNGRVPAGERETARHEDQVKEYRKLLYERYVSSSSDFAPKGRDESEFSSRRPYLRRLIGRCFPSDKQSDILELGCGNGALLYYARLAGFENARGVDCSIEQVREAERLGIPGVRQGDILDVIGGLADGSQDVVVAFDVLEHFTKDESCLVVSEALRILRPGGRLILHLPNAESPFGARPMSWDFTHEQVFTRRSIGQLLRAVGFSVVDCHEDMPIIHGVKSLGRHLLWRVIRLGLRFYLTVETGLWDRKAIFSQGFLVVARK